MRLYINVDHVATIREARGTDEPDPVRAAVLVELAGADGITVHLREDRRHIQDRDVKLLMRTARTVVNLEMATAPDIVDLACGLRPHQVTLVPERREEVTTEGGLDLSRAEVRQTIGATTRTLQSAGIRVSLFIDPDTAALEESKDLGVEAVELHTGEYANADFAERPYELDRLVRAGELGRELGLDIHAGHGLTYENVSPVAAIPTIEELNIGHSIVSRAVLVGMERAVREMKDLLRIARSQDTTEGNPT